ncbi:MAG: TerB family tellurite resistance protein [Acidithiobacillales bacterium]
MLDSLKRFFEERISGTADRAAPKESEQALRLAASALLFEVVRADGKVTDEELVVMRAAVQSVFTLSREEAEELARLGEAESENAASIYEFTRLVDQSFSPEEKKRLVELLWLVAFADGRKDPEEEGVVRKIAGLLHVSHPDFIDAKIRARAESGLG